MEFSDQKMLDILSVYGDTPETPEVDALNKWKGDRLVGMSEEELKEGLVSMVGRQQMEKLMRMSGADDVARLVRLLHAVLEVGKVDGGEPGTSVQGDKTSKRKGQEVSKSAKKPKSLEDEVKYLF